MSKFEKEVADLLKDTAENFTSVDVRSELFPVGKHKALITKLAVLSSFHNVDNSLKEKEWEWRTPNPVVALTYANDGYAIMHRYHILGHKHYDKLSAEQKEDNAYSPSEEGFALKDGDRIPDAENTAACRRILSGVFKAVGLPPGSGLADLEVLIQERKAEVMITVAEKTKPDGTLAKVVKGVDKITVSAPVDEEFN